MHLLAGRHRPFCAPRPYPRPAVAVEGLERRALLSAVAFTIDPTPSKITLAGSAASLPFAEQGTGSLTASYTGTVNADVTGSAITFTGGSTLDAQPSGNWLPGGTPADYGVSVNSGTVDVAVRDTVLDITSGALALGDAGSFAAAGESLQFTSGTVAVDAGAFGSDSESLAGQTISNNSTNNSTIEPALDGTLTLRLRVDSTLTLNDASLGAPVTLQFTGTIVAVGQAPLPAPEITVLLDAADQQSGQTVDFGSVAPGAASPTRAFTVRNDGTKPLGITSVTPPAGYTITQALPTLIPAGQSATLDVALDTSSAGTHAGVLTIANNDADEASFTLNLTGSVAAPVGVGLTQVNVTGLPAQIIGGDKKAKASAAVVISNTGADAFSGPVTVTLFASTDAVADAGTDTKLVEVTKNLKIKAGAAAKPLKLKVQFPAVAADGDFFLIATASGTGVAGGTSSAVADGGAVHIEKPVVDLVAANASPAPVTFTLGKSATLSVPLMNNGNVPAKGSVNLDLLLSTDGTADTATPLGTIAAKVAINPGASKSLKLKAPLPAGAGIPAGSFFLLIRVNGVGTLAGLNASDGTLLPAIPVTITG